MERSEELFALVMEVFRQRYGDELEKYIVPPPVFTELGGEFIQFSQDQKELTARFPIEERFLNPYGVLQGGMIAAAIDNTLGPLSMLVAPPNLTRKLEIKYSRPARLSDKWLIVTARLARQENRRLFFKAEARDPEDSLIGRAEAMHWIIDECWADQG
ncbi:MAG: PaaI family thioesterase [Anaerolineales bacterium]